MNNNNENLSLRRLEMTSKDLKSLLDLQDKIIAGLHPDEQHFILHRTVEDFSKALGSNYMYVFGIFDEERMVAQSILSLPGDDVKREIPEFGCEYKNSEVAVFKAVLVDPEYRGQGLMKQMLKVRENVAKENGRKIAITQIAADNPASWVNALQYGMKITKVDFDPEDKAEVIYLQKDLDGKSDVAVSNAKSYDLNLGKDIHKNVPMLFNKMMTLSQSGMVGISWSKQKNCITWNQRADTVNAKVLNIKTQPLPLTQSKFGEREYA